MTSVSVCVPVFNGMPYLARCLESISAQTQQPDEVLLVDDGSTDGSLELCEAFVAGHPGARLVRNPDNLGLTANWSRCLELATAEWVKFVFQDDWIAPRCLEVMTSSVQDGVDLVLSGRSYEYEPPVDDRVRQSYEQARQESAARLGSQLRLVTVQELADEVRHWGSWNFLGEPVATLLRRSAAIELGGFSPHVVLLSDYLYLLRLALRGGLVWVPEQLAGFLVHPASTSGRLRASFGPAVIEPLAFHLAVLQDPELAAAMPRATPDYVASVRYLAADALHRARLAVPPQTDAWERLRDDPVLGGLLRTWDLEHRRTGHRIARRWRQRRGRTYEHLRVLSPGTASLLPPD